MGAPQPVQLDAVLERAQHPVGLAEDGGIGPTDVPTPGQGGQCVEGGAGVEGLVGAPVDELQQLHGELDVTQPARPELELAGGLGTGDVLLDPAPHGLDVVDEVLAGGGLPHEGPHRLEVLGTEGGVAGEVTRLEQRLELPGLRPPFVVSHV